jgi:hypothetical protein
MTETAGDVSTLKSRTQQRCKLLEKEEEEEDDDECFDMPKLVA